MLFRTGFAGIVNANETSKANGIRFWPSSMTCANAIGFAGITDACGSDHVTWLDLLLKGLGLVQSPWEAINEEAAPAAVHHSLTQQPNCHLQHQHHTIRQAKKCVYLMQSAKLPAMQ